MQAVAPRLVALGPVPVLDARFSHRGEDVAAGLDRLRCQIGYCRSLKACFRGTVGSTISNPASLPFRSETRRQLGGPFRPAARVPT